MRSWRPLILHTPSAVVEVASSSTSPTSGCTSSVVVWGRDSGVYFLVMRLLFVGSRRRRGRGLWESWGVTERGRKYPPGLCEKVA